jgi:tetratricopeptide (TPR) repeat protein
MQEMGAEWRNLVELASAATRARNWSEALRLWQTARNRFPDIELMWAGEAGALRELGRLDDAEQLLTVATGQFPSSAALGADWARIAQLRLDWVQALARWEAVQSGYPDRVDGHLGVGISLRELRQFDASDAVLSKAIEIFPENSHLRIAHAWVAHHRHDWEEALRRWEPIRSFYSDLIEGHFGVGTALRELRRFDESDAVLSKAIEIFPGNPHLRIAHAWVAHHRRHWEDALRRWNSVRVDFPENPVGFNGAGVVLRELRRLDAAEEMFSAAVTAFPDSPELTIGYASIASKRSNWAEALIRWEKARTRLPDNPEVYAGVGEALRELRRFDEAESVLSDAINKFPHQVSIAIHRALVPTRQSDWSCAIPRWRELRERFPDNQWAAAAAADALWHARLDGALPDDDAPSAAAISGLTSRMIGGERTEGSSEIHLLNDRDLLMRFESLGSNCEFGIIQRQAGCEPLGLLRWTAISPDKLALALRERFHEIANPDLTRIHVSEAGEYIVRNTRYDSVMHSFVLQRHVNEADFVNRQCRRLNFLGGKLMDDLQEGEKIFVYKNDKGITKGQIQRLHRAVRQRGRSTLLCVLLRDAQHRAGLVEDKGNGLLLGYIDRFSPPGNAGDSAHEAWLAICQAAYRLWRDKQRRR